jgi:hypothetical protein
MDEPRASDWRARVDRWPIGWIVVGIAVIALVIVVAAVT